MEPEFEQRLHWSSKETLIRLLQELCVRHPALQVEMTDILGSLTSVTGTDADGDESGEEVTEDWDFSGDEHVVLRSLARPPLLPLDSEAYRQRIENYATRLGQESPQVIAEDLAKLLEEAELRAEQQDYAGALDLYALLFDERLVERNTTLTPILDEAIDIASPTLEVLLEDASSNALFDATTIMLSPLLTTNVRLHWLKRLFALWLKRLDAHSTDEDLPEIMLNVAWDEDIPLLRSLAQNELQRQPRSERTNIVDFARQYRTRALEKFLKELPRA